MRYLLIPIVGVVAGMLSGVIGTGSSMILMPILVILYGPKEAVPIMAIGAIMGNLGKVLAWWREIDWRAVGSYAASAVPGAILGVNTLLALPSRVVDVALGVFFVAMIPLRRWLARRAFRLSLVHLFLVGAPVGLLTGIVVSTGPITVPVFMAYGLDRGAFIATEAAGSLAVYGAKVATFRGLGALPPPLVFDGLVTGASLMTGSFFAKRIVLGLSAEAFRRLIDGLMLVSGASLLWEAAR